MSPMPTEKTQSLADPERWQELSILSDEALLQSVIALEEEEEVSFPGSHYRLMPPDRGRHFARSEKATRDRSFEELLHHGEDCTWRPVFDSYCEIATADWEQTWESCRTAAVTELLHDKRSAYRLALIAWHKHRASADESHTASLYQQLQAMPPDERNAVLAAFGRDGAVSAAYEGIAIDPANLTGL